MTFYEKLIEDRIVIINFKKVIILGNVQISRIDETSFCKAKVGTTGKM